MSNINELATAYANAKQNTATTAEAEQTARAAHQEAETAWSKAVEDEKKAACDVLAGAEVVAAETKAAAEAAIAAERAKGQIP